MLLYITGTQPVITKNTAVFHSNSIKYYHFKQSSCSSLPTATTSQRARGWKGGQLPKDSRCRGWGGPAGSVSSRDGFFSHPQLHSTRARRTAARRQRAPAWAPAAEPSSRGEARCLLCVRTLAAARLLPNLHFHSVSDKIKSSPLQLPCANPCVTQSPLTLCQQVLRAG